MEERQKVTQRAIGDVMEEEKRIRQNIAALKGSAEERPLAVHLSDALLAQEHKLAPLQARSSDLTEQWFADKKQLAARFHDLRFNLRLNPAQPEDDAPPSTSAE